MTKEDAEKRIQELLAEVTALADEHKVEFTWQNCTMHYLHRTDLWDSKNKKSIPVTVTADRGLLVSDEEWESSNCYGPVDQWKENEIYPKVDEMEQDLEKA